jgi:hypothetical protein
MALKHITTVRLRRQGVRLAWAIARAAERLGNAGERLKARLEAIVEVFAPLTAPLSVA